MIQSEFYASQEESIVEDTFRKVVLKAGKFDTCYFDNGSQYIAKQLKLSLGKLGITIRHAPRASGKSKGKCEKFHQVVDSYLREAKAHQIRTLEQLNQYWEIFLEEYYLKGSVSTTKAWAAPFPPRGSHRCRNGEGTAVP